MSIRIIAGDLRGFVLKGPKTLEITRPILARVKKSLFDILMPYFRRENVKFLDMFSGTGCVGIESISRGVEKVFFIERDKEMYECILNNLKYCKKEENATVYCTDVFDFLETYRGEKFDIIFAGPPYPANLCNNILNALTISNVLKEDSVVILQHSSKENILDKTECLEKFRTKVYGDTILDFFKRF
jgi:16S rRNA (guanine966-N2)-methyltransferase